ncbi:uncharacterized protein TNCV_4781421 [Trichonephila clavipes]|nr:uncharacterized protein TNCV_4781421 [Trichonephila clavipes]
MAAGGGCRVRPQGPAVQTAAALRKGPEPARGLLATDHVILNHGQVTWTTPELALPLLTTTPHQREDISALDRFSVHRCPTRRVFSGTGLELVTKPATIRCLYHSATAANRKTTRREDRRIVRQALEDPTVTRSTIRADVGVAIVPQTISRHLAEANIKSKRHFRALPLTPEHLQLRLQWCQARSMWNVTDWQKVVFSDESRFVLGTDDNRVRVWRHPGQRNYSPTQFYVTLPAELA